MKKLLLLALSATLLFGCAQRVVPTDYDPTFDFDSIQTIQVVADDSLEESPSSKYIQDLVTQRLSNTGLTIDQNSPIKLKIISFTEERPNDQSMNIGIGTGTRSRNSSIGIGTNVQIPIGNRMLDYQVIQLDLIDDDQVIWTTSDSARITVKDGKGLHKVQQRLIEKLLENFPTTNEEAIQ